MQPLLNLKLSIKLRGRTYSIHILMLLFALATILVSLGTPEQAGPSIRIALAGLGILCLSLAIHETAHLIAARRVGGDFEELLIWPLGSLIPPVLTPWGKEHHVASNQELLVSGAGPLANLTVCLLLTPVVLMYGLSWGPLLNPLSLPTSEPLLADYPLADHPLGIKVLALGFWINAVLLIANLLPAFPLDGARLLRAALRRKMSFEEATLWTGRVSIVVAVVLFIVGLIVNEAVVRVPVVLLGVFAFFAARHEMERFGEPQEPDTFMGYDFSQGYTSLERSLPPEETEQPVPQPAGPPDGQPPPGGSINPLQRWLQRRKEEKLKQQQEIEAEEERRFDELLARIHASGSRNCLSQEEKDLMDRVSQRVRSRLKG